MIQAYQAEATTKYPRRARAVRSKKSGLPPVRLDPKQWERYRQIPDRIDYVPHPLFSRPHAAKKLFDQEIEVPQWHPLPQVPEGPQAIRRCPGRLTHEDEVTLFLRYNYSRYRVSKLARLQRRRPTVGRARKILGWYERAQKARAQLVRANMALVLAMAQRSRINDVEFAELISEGNMALLRSVGKFDVSRGFKFSTYACGAILKSFSQLARKVGRHRQRFLTSFPAEFEPSDHQEAKQEARRNSAIEDVRQILAHNRANLTHIERRIVTERFALGRRRKAKSLAEVGKMVGLSSEYVRQIQKAALSKIRFAFTACATG